LSVALLSIVVPAYRVQGYLRECLDSILDQSFTDLEVVGVDDCSPDGSGQIMDEYAARDSRVRVVHLDRNVNLGPAREVGLRHATGEYVWFLDSDDWLAPGAVRAVVNRLRAAAPDVLIVNHQRVPWNPRSTPRVAGDFLPEAPEVFTVRDWPRALDILHVAWNKVVRRDLLARLSLPFPPGWYEDVAFTYPLLLAAGRVSVLDRVCVNYRQRRVGAATRTQGEGHLAIFGSWARVFERLDPGEPLRPQLFQRMIWHFLMVLGNENRITPRLRRRFFAQASEFYRRYAPPGFQPPEGVDGVKFRALQRGSYRLFEARRIALHGLERGKRLVRSAGRPVKRTLRRLARTGRESLLRTYYRIQLRLPRDESLAVYGAYWYRGYLCNPAAIYEKARELAPSVRGVWVVGRGREAAMPEGVPYVVAGTPAYYRALARATWLVNNVNFPDFVVKRPGSVHVMTHHGTPLKAMGLDEYRYPARALQDAGRDAAMVRSSATRLLRRCDRWDFSITQNNFTTQVWERAYPCPYETLEVGYPRNDRLANATAEQVRAARERVGIPEGKTAVLYAPTHREYHAGYRPALDVEELADDLGPDTVVLSRAHYFYDRQLYGRQFYGRQGAAGSAAGNVLEVSGYPAVEDLYLAADVLVTDYSSMMFDYAVLDRPIVVFAPDWAAYRTVRGVTFDLPAEPPGAVATSYPDLVDAFATGAYRHDAASKARAQFRNRFCALDDGHAAERVVRRVFLDEE
jgi:CDP-glycerol glycerophosphotransferase